MLQIFIFCYNLKVFTGNLILSFHASCILKNATTYGKMKLQYLQNCRIEMIEISGSTNNLRATMQVWQI